MIDKPAHAQPSSRASLVQRLTVSQYLALACGALIVVAIAGIVAGELALSGLSSARSVALAHISPASTTALDLSNALLDEETGVRGYLLSGGQSQFLAPYREGRRRELEAYDTLERLTRGKPLMGANAELILVKRRAEAWHTQYAIPTITEKSTSSTSRRSAGGSLSTDAGKTMFDGVRRALGGLNAAVQSANTRSRSHINRQQLLVEIVFAVFSALLLIAALVLAVALRFGISAPLARLSRNVRDVARGRFELPLRGGGPRDIIDLASDVDSMRERIVYELEAVRQANENLDGQARELERSNSELEQFAYVASHDLQEPLRKVASFTQLLQRRYEGQLDERADQYIAFAVDGAKRMQILINDLLAFSRVGRIRNEHVLVDLGKSLRDALSGLSTLIEETGATIEVGDLPSVHGETGLLSLVFQNLVGNALKFHGDRPPLVKISARRQGPDWLISVSDNGIGIDPRYAERIFVIFQRLHSKERYEGTGIGLAMCRKIIEYHTGHIWLDRESHEGTTLHFTLPSAKERIS